MTALDEAMRRHPAGRARWQDDALEWLIADAQDQQAMDLANRGQVTAELHAGGPMRRINEKHHKVSDRSGDWIDGITMLVLLVVVVLTPMLVAGWWPA